MGVLQARRERSWEALVEERRKAKMRASSRISVKFSSKNGPTSAPGTKPKGGGLTEEAVAEGAARGGVGAATRKSATLADGQACAREA